MSLSSRPSISGSIATVLPPESLFAFFHVHWYPIVSYVFVSHLLPNVLHQVIADRPSTVRLFLILLILMKQLRGLFQ